MTHSALNLWLIRTGYFLMIEYIRLQTYLNRVLPDDAQCIKIVTDLNRVLPNTQYIQPVMDLNRVFPDDTQYVELVTDLCKLFIGKNIMQLYEII